MSEFLISYIDDCIEEMQELGLLSIEIVPQDNILIVKYADGAKRWYQDKMLFYVEYADGTREWYKMGNLHREDGPAVIYKNGNKAWYHEGKLQCEERAGIKRWYKEGRHICTENPDGSSDWYGKNGETIAHESFGPSERN